MTSSVAVVKILQSARAEVAKGWCKNQLEDQDGNVCVVGAIHRADLGSARALTCLTLDGAHAFEEVQAHVPRGERLDLYNNAKTTEKQDVLDLFDKTLADLGGLA